MTQHHPNTTTIDRTDTAPSLIELMLLHAPEGETPEQRDFRLLVKDTAWRKYLTTIRAQRAPSTWPPLPQAGTLRFQTRPPGEAERLINELSSLTRHRLAPLLDQTRPEGTH